MADPVAAKLAEILNVDVADFYGGVVVAIVNHNGEPHMMVTTNYPPTDAFNLLKLAADDLESGSNGLELPLEGWEKVE